MSKRAVILAGGKGTRLRPYTVSLPKPLVPIIDKPVLELIVIKLKKYGFEHITLTVNHLAEIIKAFFGDGSKWGVNIDYILEDKPLSTMGPLTLINDLPENFLVMNGDVLTDLNLDNFYNNHTAKGNLFTISATRRHDMIDYGVLHADEDKNLVQFEEKPTFDFLVSMGIYMVNKNILDYIPKDEFFGFDHLMKELINKKKYPQVLEHEGSWLDIGRADDYEKAVRLAENSGLLND